MVSLGCPKNKVDSEAMIGLLAKDGHGLADIPEDADVIVVNTCGFIESAKEESIDTILEMAEYTKGTDKKLVVTGCLVQRYHEEVAEGIPEIDVMLGSSDFGDIVESIKAPSTKRLLPIVNVTAQPTKMVDHTTPRIIVGGRHSVYLKIAEGCDRPCGFCIIPKLRGEQRSRSLDSIVSEANMLVSGGAKEINLIAQDLTRYGYELPHKPTLADLIRKLEDVAGLEWVRLHYTYPTAFSDDLIDAIAGSSKVVPYIDVPLQHINDGVLKVMRRGHSSRVTLDLLNRLRSKIDGLVLRSTFIVGHPGETEQAFQELLQFVTREKLDHVGAFTYSQEPGTHSATLAQDVPAEVAIARQAQIMEAQKIISRDNLRKLMGQKLQVLVDGPSEESELVMAGRYYGQAPSVDGLVYLQNGDFQSGELVEVVVTDTSDYDLVASPEFN